MNDAAFDRLARAYMADGPDALADRVLSASLDRVDRTPQKRSALGRISVRSGALSLGAGSLAVTAVLLIAVLAVPVAGSGAAVVAPAAAEPIRTVWTTNGEVVAQVVLRPAGGPPPLLAAAIYDRFDGHAWVRSQVVTEHQNPGEALHSRSVIPFDTASRRSLDLTITPTRPVPFVLWTGIPVRVDEPVNVDTIAGEPVGIIPDESGSPYVVTALVPAGQAQSGPTPSRLRAAGADYPTGLLERYGSSAGGPPAFKTPEAQALLDEIVAAGGRDPYDLAMAAERLFQDPGRFTYDTDLRDVACDRLGVVDCLAVHRRGFCQYFATAMAVLLRELGIPTRFVQGFVPGEPDPVSGALTIRDAAAHAWVQVYFPGYGWIDFDPTPGGRKLIAPFPSSAP